MTTHDDGHIAPCPYSDSDEGIPIGEVGCTCTSAQLTEEQVLERDPVTGAEVEALARTLDKHWLSVADNGSAICSCGQWQWDPYEEHPTPEPGTQFYPFSEHVARSVAALRSAAPALAPCDCYADHAPECASMGRSAAPPVAGAEDDLLAALCDATAVDERIYFNDDKVEHGRAVLANLNEAGYTVVALAAPPVAGAEFCGWCKDHPDNLCDRHKHLRSTAPALAPCDCYADHAPECASMGRSAAPPVEVGLSDDARRYLNKRVGNPIIDEIRAALRSAAPALDEAKMAEAIWNVRAGGSIDNRDAAAVIREYAFADTTRRTT